MFNFLKIILLILIPCLFLLSSLFINQFPAFHRMSSSWLQYKDPEEAGWSTEKLKEAESYYKSLDSTAAMAIYNGKVLFAWGDIDKNTSIHSVRKSLLSGLYGIHAEQGTIDINSTLEDLNINDFSSLSMKEKQATIEHLLTSSSGIYHRAGEESYHMRRSRPSRGSHLPGDYFYYNNWDFNVLGTIFNQETETDLFTEFSKKIAIPLGMEDFDLENMQYKFERGRSQHPSYLFKMSARDLARYGQLYLQKGKWDDEQIIPEKWIEESTKLQAPVPRNSVYGYGYLWWVADSTWYEDKEMYSAVGRRGQSIDIIPEENLVFVHRVNTDVHPLRLFMREVHQSDRLKLLEKVLDAKVSEPKENPKIIPLQPTL
jgi:CubicO group peptidase (beta-lactamase class C family)